jgi:hypothetical protein
MGHMLKNTVVRTGSRSLGIPQAATTSRPNPAVAGQTQWSTTNSRLEYYNGTSWQGIAHEGNVTITKNTFTTDGTNTNYGPMSYSYTAGQEAQVLVFLATVYQNPGVNYTFLGNTTIKFTSTPTTGQTVLVLHNYASTIAA